MNTSFCIIRILLVASFTLLIIMHERWTLALGPMHYGRGKRRGCSPLKNSMSATTRSTYPTRPPYFPPYRGPGSRGR
uniref:Putative secreted protein n=1 Tax=Rhipicephalus microplus TaxID=6941 RepID=A0A6G5A1F2_RHIMP